MKWARVNSGIAVPEKPEGFRTNDEHPSRPRMKRWALIAVTLLAAFIVILIAVSRLRTHSAITTGPGSAASAQTSVRLTGKTEAVGSRAILAPLSAGQQVGTLTIVKLVASGSRVKQGDLLVEFDRQAQLKRLDRQKGAERRSKRQGHGSAGGRDPRPASRTRPTLRRLKAR